MPKRGKLKTKTYNFKCTRYALAVKPRVVKPKRNENKPIPKMLEEKKG